MIKVRHRKHGFQRNCPSQACADKMLLNKKNGEPVWELADRPIKGADPIQKRVYGTPVKKETLKEVIKQEEKKAESPAKPVLDVPRETSELQELQERWEARNGKKPHWKKNIETLKKELGDT